MNMRIKTFLLGKDGEENGRQDALRFNAEKGLYAVADGVSNSFHPEIVARILCEKFVSMNPEDITVWKELPSIVLLPGIKDLWQTEVDEYMSSLSGRLLRHEQYNYETWKIGASTFCGIHYDEKNELVRYAILGDSTLFLHFKDGSVKELNSSIKRIDNDGIEITDYSNSTDAILSDGTCVGEWLIGEISMSDICSISIMTDGMAKWFQKSEIDGLTPEHTLWKLQTNDMFISLAENARKNGDMDDDLAVILIKLGGDDSQCEPITTSLSLDNIASDIDATDSSDNNLQDIESEINEKQSNVDTELSSTGIISISENPIELRTEEDEKNFEVNEQTTLPLEMQSNDTPSDICDEINSDDGIAKEDETTADVIAESERIIETIESSVDKIIKNRNESKLGTYTEANVESNEFIGNDEAIETESSEDLTESEDTDHRSSLMDKIKATLRIWRNYPTDPTK